MIKVRKENVEFRLIGAIDESHKRSVKSSELHAWINDGIISHDSFKSDVKEEIASADVVVLPSYREGTPRTLLEAAAVGRPILTTNVPGCKEVVEDGGNGFLCEARSSKSLAKKMELFLALSFEERVEMGANSRKKVERQFDEQLVIDSYMNKIGELVE